MRQTIVPPNDVSPEELAKRLLGVSKKPRSAGDRGRIRTGINPLAEGMHSHSATRSTADRAPDVEVSPEAS